MLHADIPKLKEGGVDAVWLGIVTHPWPRNGFARASANIDYAELVLRKNASDLLRATTSGDIERAKSEGRIAVLLGVEGMHMLGGRVESIRVLHRRGVRYITMAHFSSNRFATTSAASWRKRAALPPSGIEAVRLMNELGMLIDVAHTHTDLIAEVCRLSKDPVVVSHGAASALRPTFRNLTDEDIRNVAGTGGVIGLIYATHWLSDGARPPSLDVVVDHADHIKRLVGVDHLALGSDWDGFIRTPDGMRDAADLPRLTQLFLDRGYSHEDVEKILGLNFMRVFRQVCG
jgi:membrane dipeptidase